ncbi:hypothetical protein Naga_100946g2 [Nannochloropsis gaditana]|uniref:Uncharacterized protein n=1 Tax=Nannochloropsis gaditana TaxID=72520 RepID=W7TGY7_9STRA|nr:hypothetical protein Naga_100946g2 [Nannochloropsis gaditana]
MSYFQCAREIEHHKRTPETTKVVWYLVSDSLRLKELALMKFGQDLVVTSTEPSRHVLCAKDGLTDCNESGEMAESLAAAAADMMGLAETDYIILTRQSGFGKVAAWLNMRWHNVWWLSPGEPQMHACGARSTCCRHSYAACDMIKLITLDFLHKSRGDAISYPEDASRTHGVHCPPYATKELIPMRAVTACTSRCGSIRSQQRITRPA